MKTEDKASTRDREVSSTWWLCRVVRVVYELQVIIMSPWLVPSPPSLPLLMTFGVGALLGWAIGRRDGRPPRRKLPPSHEGQEEEVEEEEEEGTGEWGWVVGVVASLLHRESLLCLE